MAIKFTQLSDRLKYPSTYRGRLNTLHSAVVSYVIQHYEYGYAYRKKVVDVINTLTYIVLNGDTIPQNWSLSDPLNNIDIVDEDICRSSIGDLYLHDKQIDWDVEPSSKSDSNSISEAVVVPTSPVLVQTSTAITKSTKFTDKSDLYIRPPVVPQFDTSRVWIQGNVNDTDFVIYQSLPEIPKKQNEISVTTDVRKMSQADLLNLFPNQFIRTRSACMYDYHENLDSDLQLGVVIPIKNYTQKQLIDNLVKYPHIFRLVREVDGDLVSFYQHIEIDGVLYDTLEVWDSLEDSRCIPKTSEFLKEYVVRRYLLERDVDKIQHKYPMYGTLDPYLTLFMPASDYASLGYLDATELAKKCVEARVSYKQSRNPIIRRLKNA